MALEEHALWPVQSELSAGSREEREKTLCPSFEDSESKERIEHYSPRHHDFIRRFFCFCLLDSSIMSDEFDLIGELSFSLAKNKQTPKTNWNVIILSLNL